MIINLNQIYNSLIPSSILLTNAANELEYVGPGTTGQVLGINPLGGVSYLDLPSLYIVQNGLTEIPTGEVELGGTLLHDTNIQQDSWNFSTERSLAGNQQIASFYNSANVLNLGIDGIGTSLHDSVTTLTSYDLILTNSIETGIKDLTNTIVDGVGQSFSAAPGDVSITTVTLSGDFSVSDTQSINLSSGIANKTNAVINSLTGENTTNIQTTTTYETEVANLVDTNRFVISATDFKVEKYPNTRDDSSITAPTNFLYTDANGKFLSTTLNQIVASRIKNTQTVTGTTVTLPSTPNVATLDVYRNGVLQEETVDYTVSGAVLTFVVSLVAEKITSIYFV